MKLGAILLVVFDAAMQERNVTRAGRRLGSSSIQHPVWGVEVTTDPHGMPVPFVVSFTSYFIALHLAEALCLRRLFAEGRHLTQE